MRAPVTSWATRWCLAREQASFRWGQLRPLRELPLWRAALNGSHATTSTSSVVAGDLGFQAVAKLASNAAHYCSAAHWDRLQISNFRVHNGDCRRSTCWN